MKSAQPVLPVPSMERAYPSRAGVLRRGKSDSNRIVFFIHGTPGVVSDWQGVFEALSDEEPCFSILSLDRPGFGSNADWHEAESWEEQFDCFEEILLAVLDKEKELLVVGHSYGAALAVGLVERLAAAGRVSGLLLVSGVLSPAERQSRWYHRMILLPLISILAPKRYLQAAKEMVAARRKLRDLDGAWGQVDFPVTLIHGDQDRRIPLSNSEYAVAKLDQRLLKIVKAPGGGHALPRSHADLIAREIEAIFSRMRDGE